MLDELRYSVDTSTKDELEYTVLNSHADMVNLKPEPTMDGAKSYVTEPDAEMSMTLKDMQMKLLKEELELVKEDNACTYRKLGLLR